MNPTDHGSDFGVEWVDVTIEPHHVEQLANQAVRIYEATITPGTATQFHRHTHDTIYVITAGGRFRSDEPGHQITGTRVGRSTPLPRQRRRNGIDVPAPIGATTRARLSRIARIAIRIDAAYSFADVLPHQRGKGEWQGEADRYHRRDRARAARRRARSVFGSAAARIPRISSPSSGCS